MKIAVITCYDQNDHIRARVLRAGFGRCEDAEVLILKNKHTGMLRYLEMPLRILKLRFTWRPDVYVITFRGYEMLPVTLLIKGRKPLIFDEMVNAAEYLHEHKTLKPGSLPDKLFRKFYGWLLRRCRFILADTDAHAQLSADLSGVDRSRYITVPIGTDENVFHPEPSAQPPKQFTVFYYGVMVKLHGLEHVLEAAVELGKTHPDITFIMGGDKGKTQAAFDDAIKRGAHITHKPWFDFEDLPKFIHGANICVGGPFGNTPQAQFIITTKTFQFLAAGVPALIGRNKVNIAFRDKENSLVVPQGDAQAIKEAILWGYNHPRELADVGRQGRKLYEQAFSQARIDQIMQGLVASLRK
jgi:glycosyltransferase involved in cell wall biosynthesis